METGAIRPTTMMIHDPPQRRDDVAGSASVTDLPTEKTVRAAQGSDGSGAADDRRREGGGSERRNIRTGFERDLSSGSIVYRWTDETIGRVILEIPRSDKIRSRAAYDGAPRATDGSNVDRSV